MTIMKTPRSMDLEITTRCNLRCSYCSHFESPSDVPADLPLDEWLRFLEELNRCSCLEVTLQGGEPLTREDFLLLVDGIVKNRMRFSILTNGTLVTDELAAYLARTRRCTSVQVSLDGASADTHESARGKGTFEGALRGLTILKAHGIPLTVRVTIHRNNVHDLENLARLLLDEIGLPSFSTNSASYMGMCRRNSDLLQLTVEDRMTAMKTLLDLNRNYNGRIGATAGPLAEGKTWLEMERARLEGHPAMEGRGFLTGCGCSSQKLAVRADGVIVPCCQVSHIELGRINRDDLRTLWQENLELKRLRERVTIPLSSFEHCKDCPYIPYCTGNCPAMAVTLSGGDDRPAPDACLRQFLDCGGSLRELEALV